jgi:hypothetical protein
MASALSASDIGRTRETRAERQRHGPVGPLAFVDLAAVSILRDVLPVEEQTVLRCMNPYEAGASVNELARLRFAEFLRTAAIFVLDIEDTRAALHSRPPDGVMLPRLPYGRLWLEWHNVTDDGRMGPPLPLLGEGGSHMVLGIGLSEIDPGSSWDVFWPIKGTQVSAIGMIEYRVPHWRITADLLEERRAMGSEEERALIDIAITAADLTTARNVPQDRVRLPRRQREEIDDVYGGESGDAPTRPTVYYINLRRSGEGGAATGERRCRRRVRWLVRGHWRTLRSGRRTWVRAHIRGPLDAPWKGRPVYGPPVGGLRGTPNAV